MTVENTIQKPVKTAEVQAGKLKAYLAQPDDPNQTGEKRPAVIVIHEIFGLNEDIREIARRFAGEGYAALAVDLYSSGNIRAICILKLVYGILRNPLKSFAMNDLDQAITFLNAQSDIDTSQLGVIGFCMGGSFALALAVHNQQVRGASIFYGRLPAPTSTLEKACPTLGSYGADDKFFLKQAHQLEEVMKQYNRPVDVKIYPGAGHSFFNKGKAHRPEAAADAWQRTLGWFREYLPKKA